MNNNDQNTSQPENQNPVPKTFQSADWKKDLFKILRSKIFLVVTATLIVMTLLRLAYTTWDQRNTSDHNLSVHVFQVIPESVDSSLALPGNIEAIQQASIYAHVGGYLKKLYVDEGDKVKKDQLLAEIDAPETANEYNKLKAEFELKRVTAQRYRELLNEKVISQQEFDNIDTAYEETKAKFDNAAANVAFTKIRAPFDGSIARRNKYPGDLISMEAKDQTPIFIIVNESQLRVAVNVPQTDLSSLKLGDPVETKIDSYPSETFKGTVSRFDALLDSSTKTQRVLIDLQNPDGKLHAGMFASVDLHFDHKDNTIQVPNDAVEKVGDKAFVYIDTKVDGKDIAKKIPVTLGAQNLDKVEITKGLEPNQTVIHKGMLAIQDGTVIVPLPDVPQPSTAVKNESGSDQQSQATAPPSESSPPTEKEPQPGHDQKTSPSNPAPSPSSQARTRPSGQQGTTQDNASGVRETSSR